MGRQFKVQGTRLCLMLFLGLLTSPALGQNNCPEFESPQNVAERYQLFSAFQIGHGGYESVCENRCLGKQECQTQCQNEKGLEYLAKKMHEMRSKNINDPCPSLTLVCLEQCEGLGPQCAKTCAAPETIATH